MADLEVYQFPTRSDNYGVLIHDPETEATASIDAPDAEELLAALHEKGWMLTHILTTHHHHDHTAGNTVVKRMTGCTIVGPASEARSIPGIDVEVKEGDTVEIGGAKARVIETPGHTTRPCQLLFPRRQARLRRRHAVLGRLRQAARRRRQDDVASLEKLAALPPDTKLYCGHEYTNNNCRFALTVEPENAALQARAAEVAALAEEGEPSLPTTIAQELATNPFLRAVEPRHPEAARHGGARAWEIFGEIRSARIGSRSHSLLSLPGLTGQSSNPCGREHRKSVITGCPPSRA